MVEHKTVQLDVDASAEALRAKGFNVQKRSAKISDILRRFADKLDDGEAMRKAAEDAGTIDGELFLDAVMSLVLRAKIIGNCAGWDLLDK